MFDGQNLQGTWLLKVVDSIQADVGSLLSWSLTATTLGGGTPVPEPGTLALLGLGLAGLVAARRGRLTGGRPGAEPTA